MTITIIPRPGELLRTLITRAGYRPRIHDLGLDKDLDDLVHEVRKGSACDQMLKIEDECRKGLALDCGIEWAQALSHAWNQTRASLQQLVLAVDTSPIADEQGAEEVLRLFAVPMLSAFLRLVASRHPGPISDVWWRSPFAAWVHWTSEKVGVSQERLLEGLANHLDIDQRSIERWMAGAPVRELRWPFRQTVDALNGANSAKLIGTKELDDLAGWLTLALAFQSLSAEERTQIRQDFYLRPQHPWSLDHVVHELQRQGFKSGERPVRVSAIPLLSKIENAFAEKPRDLHEIGLLLQKLQKLINLEPEFWQHAYQYIHDWHSARLAATGGHEADALARYDAAVEGSWWYAGPNQHPILNEALLYAVGVGDVVAAKRYWDKTFLLGLNNWPKRDLDEQERRRLAFGFEKMFAPQKAKDRIPPKQEFVVREGDFEVSPQDLKAPNRKIKRAEGRTRRTPLMEAIQEGTLGDVKRLLAAGGDPNDFIKESGEGPLSYAMRRACDGKDPIIMEHLLSLDLLPETVNRQSSTKRETPLKIAIEMANAKAVDRLIELGADCEAECDYQPSALCYAMLLLHGSIHRHDTTQEMGYLEGKGRADVYDAKDGAVLDVDLAARRKQLLSMRYSSSRHEAIWEEMLNDFIRPAEDHRQVIKTLLRHKADANRRYKVEPHHIAEWTPTLFAAQVGDIEIFRALVENGGDPGLTLMASSALERYDALWVAIDHGRHSIVEYLTETLPHGRLDQVPAVDSR